MFCSTVNKAKSGGRQLSGDVEGLSSSLSLSEESREIHIAVSSVLSFVLQPVPVLFVQYHLLLLGKVPTPLPVRRSS